MQCSRDDSVLSIGKISLPLFSASGLEVRVGEVVALNAPSGSGKSLFMRALADLIPNDGVVCVDGCERATFSAPQWRQRVVYVAAKSAWWLDRVGDHFENLTWCRETLSALDLPIEAMDWPVSRLSSGESQRLCLLRALEPSAKTDCAVRYLLLDEPTAALDQPRQMLVEGLLQGYLDQKRIGILLVSHDERQSRRFAQKHWQFVDGKIIASENTP